MPKPKKTKFTVEITQSELLSTPYRQGHFFIKWKLLPKSDFSHLSSRQQVEKNTVSWPDKIKFECKTQTDVTGQLEPVYLRVSVRKESNGGKSQDKLGVVNINLAEFAGARDRERRYLLQAAKKSQGKDNSILRVVLSMVLASGDPCFKVPAPVLGQGHIPVQEKSATAAGSIEEVKASLIRLADLSEQTERITSQNNFHKAWWDASGISAQTFVDNILKSDPPEYKKTTLITDEADEDNSMEVMTRLSVTVTDVDGEID
eukprot:m.53128 g.53128  ORF g.53128 m.53128 type:complete len:260 (+) comp10844_c0_seq3:438-1217(+)